ncbi:MAG TPA: phycobilisome protein [Halomicronema sp.]
MLTQFARLSVAADGRYATSEELQFLKDYFKSFNIRLSAYQKIRASETEIIRQVQAKIKSIDSTLFQSGSQDATNKWKLDTVRVLRHTAAALLFNDTDRFKEQFISWFQTILKAMNVERSAELTYQVMLEVIRQYLTPEEATIFIPLWELNRLKY